MIAILAEKIKSAKLTRKQTLIAEYFLQYPEKIGNMSSKEVATAIGVSDASIIRFSREIGYSGFTELKKDIYSALTGEANSTIRNMQLTDRFDTVSKKYKDEDIPDAYLETMIYNVSRSFQQNPLENYEKVMELIRTSQRKYITGLRGCMGVATQFTRNLSFIVDDVTLLPWNEAEAVGKLQEINKQDVFIMFEFARYYNIDMMLIELAKSHNAQICVIADSPLAPAVKYADIALYAETVHLSFANSAVGLTVLTEYILTLLTRQNKAIYKKKAAERDRYTEGFRFVKND